MNAPLTFRAAQYAALGDPHRLAIIDALTIGDHTPTQLANLTELPSNLLAFHLRVLSDAQIIRRVQSEGDKRRRYVTLHELSPHTGREPSITSDTPILFVCTHNQARSQFAAALWRRHTGKQALSAGVKPAAAPDSKAVAVGLKYGLDATGWHTCGYSEVTTTPEVVISVCDRAYEAGVPFAASVHHWSVADPAGQSSAQYEKAMRQIDRRITRLLAINTLFSDDFDLTNPNLKPMLT
ncbi:MAG: helix-turn-helix domain-containing protein [Nitriliruptoraceae bacterium]